MQLNRYLIDIVRPGHIPDVVGPVGVQLVSYSVLAETAEAAYERFMNDENAGVVVYEGDIADSVVVNLEQVSG
jgi:hypothetical protein